MLLNHIAAGFCWIDPQQPDRNHETRLTSYRFHRRRVTSPSAAFHGVRMEKNGHQRRSICTADELHRVVVSNSDWKLALWRYLPSPEVPLFSSAQIFAFCEYPFGNALMYSFRAPLRNHPLLLLSGVATNAIGYDLSPESSFARYMSAQGFDTWILEVRGVGLSTIGDSLEENEECLKNLSEIDSAISDEIGKNSASPARLMGLENLGSPEITTKFEEMRLTRSFMDIFTRISEKLAGFLNPDSLEGGKNSALVGQIKDFNRRLRAIIEGQQLVPAQILELQDRFSATLEEFQKQIQLIIKYDWDFDHYLEEDVPAAMEYIRAQCQPRDGKLLAIGHSMGGILLYARLSRCCFEGKDSGLASVVTLASSLDYTPSKSSLKLLLPLAKPAHYPPYVLSWLNYQISAQDMMDQKLFEKLVLNNFCTIPSKILLQLSSVFQEGGLRDRSGTFFYKDHLCKIDVPILAVAGDQDLICPPEAVYETVKLIPEDLITYKVFGELDGPHYAHYDLVGGRLAADELYPCITEFLSQHDIV
ncbi:hypothetical protein LR48_Vigan10g031600 [Vigna angularis]|uniref:AB hydrolase-1 domain-containing protein n=1 Tax=Phaseolus angularis TaxID=3914 RepID=A0A0L9VI94_PHAAN|nr:hypothetical protein LR48_Vigan10g031600 [Vigna angularis]